MLKKLMLILFLSLVMSGAAAPVLKSFVGVGSITAYAFNDDAPGDEGGDQDEQSNDEGDE